MKEEEGAHFKDNIFQLPFCFVSFSDYLEIFAYTISNKPTITNTISRYIERKTNAN